MRRAPGLVVLAVLVVGCAAHPEASKRTLVETKWAGRAFDWLGRHFQSATWEGCRESLPRDVGRPPTDDVEALGRNLERICRSELAAARTVDLSQAYREREAAGRLGEKTSRLLLVYGPRENRHLPTIRGPSSRSRIDPRYSAAARALATRTIEVRCWTARDWLALTYRINAFYGEKAGSTWLGRASPGRGTDTISLSPAVCGPLDDFAYGGRRPRNAAQRTRLAEAIETLAHETQHLAWPRPASSESQAECWGMQLIRRTTSLLGGDRITGRHLARIFLNDIYPAGSPSYQSKECVPGGAFDRRPNHRGFWP